MEKYGRIDCLINNAGQRKLQWLFLQWCLMCAYDSRNTAGDSQVSCPFLDPPKTAIDDITADDFRRLLDINLVSYFLFAKVSMLDVESNIMGNLRTTGRT